jgi:two-component system sensor histidine kinase KdpD
VEDIVGTAFRRISGTTKNHLLKTQLLPGLALIRGDCVLLEHVLVNLIDNAVKYSPPGTVITIGARQDKQEIVVEVMDHGAGVPESDLPYIFEKFFRARQTSSIGGTGLGLSICKSIVEAHGGRIWAENRPEGGTVIRFTLPAQEPGVLHLSKAGENE